MYHSSILFMTCHECDDFDQECITSIQLEEITNNIKLVSSSMVNIHRQLFMTIIHPSTQPVVIGHVASKAPSIKSNDNSRKEGPSNIPYIPYIPYSTHPVFRIALMPTHARRCCNELLSGNRVLLSLTYYVHGPDFFLHAFWDKRAMSRICGIHGLKITVHVLLPAAISMIRH